jgi:hypothetical protein
LAFALAFGLAAMGSDGNAVPWSAFRPEAGTIADGRLAVALKPAERKTLLALRDFKPPDNRFVLKTVVDCQAIVGFAVMEMHVVMADGNRLTVRTKDTGGPMAVLANGAARDVELPFVSDPRNPPKEVVVDLVSEGGGEGEWRFQAFRFAPWQRWSLTWLAAGGFAAGLGVVFGMVFGVYGLLAAVPSSRRGAYAFGIVGAVLGLVLAGAGPLLYELAYPFGIWLPTLIAGIVTFSFFAVTLPMVKKGIESADRMAASADPSLEPA